MSRNTVVLSSIFMSFIALLFLAEARHTLNGAKEYKELAGFWKSKVAREQLKKLLVQGKFADFKQDVALILPEEVKKRKVEEEKQKLRDLASVIPHEGTHEILLGYSASKMLTEGKAFVKQREYKPGIETLKKMIHKFPDSPHVVEAHYLIIEAYYQQEKNINVISWVDKMVELFPANRLTGYALLKVGGLYEIDGRHDDAVRIYKTIVAVYDDQKLVKQAQGAVDQLDL